MFIYVPSPAALTFRAYACCIYCAVSVSLSHSVTEPTASGGVLDPFNTLTPATMTLFSTGQHFIAVNTTSIEDAFAVASAVGIDPIGAGSTCSVSNLLDSSTSAALSIMPGATLTRVSMECVQSNSSNAAVQLYVPDGAGGSSAVTLLKSRFSRGLYVAQRLTQLNTATPLVGVTSVTFASFAIVNTIGIPPLDISISVDWGFADCPVSTGAYAFGSTAGGPSYVALPTTYSCTYKKPGLHTITVRFYQGATPVGRMATFAVDVVCHYIPDGYFFSAGLDVAGYDLSCQARSGKSVATLAAECNANPSCVTFNIYSSDDVNENVSGCTHD